jgi:hypothetical protein
MGCLTLGGRLRHFQLCTLTFKEQIVRIGEFVFVGDPATVLRMLDESGLFEIVSPDGDAFHLTCQSGTVTRSESRGNDPNHRQQDMKWCIRKLDDFKDSKSRFVQS